MRTRPRRLSSLRSRSYGVVVAVALSPIVLVASARVMDAFESASMRAGVAAAASDGAREVQGDASPKASLDSIATTHEARVRLFDAQGEVIADSNHDRTKSLRDAVGDLFFGPDGVPTLVSDDASLPPPYQRAEVQAALVAGHSDGCEVELGGRILVCRHAIASNGSVVLAEKSSARAIRSFYDARYPLMKLTLYVMGVGLVLAFWLGRRMVRPIEALRKEVLARADSPFDVAPIPVSTDDEVGDLAEAYNRLLQSLSDRRRTNEAFAADLAHELKSPVAAVKAAAEALSSGKPLDDERARRLGRALGDSGGRLDALVTRFLDLARAEAGLPDEERSRFDVADLVRGLCASIGDDERHGPVAIAVETQPASIEGVAMRVEGALRNVLENAVSFAGESGKVAADVRVEGDHCVIVIRDSGPGIAADKLARVFDRFFTDRRDARGTGLGLALSKAIVEAHGGTIEAASKPGEGATFTIRFPLVSQGVHTSGDDDSTSA